MAINLSLPWAYGTGHGAAYTGLNWQQMHQRIIAPTNGVLRGFDDEMTVTESTPNALTVEVGAGSAIVEGVYIYNDDTVTLTIDANSSGNPRIDRVVLQVDWSTQLASFVVVAGTPAATPVAPTPTQTTGTLWQMNIAQIAVADAASSITDSEILNDYSFANLHFNIGGNEPTVTANSATEVQITQGATSVIWPVFVQDQTLDITADADWISGDATDETSDALHYVYTDADGDVKISTTAPNYADFNQVDSGEYTLWYDTVNSRWWRCIGRVYNDSSGDLLTDFAHVDVSDPSIQYLINPNTVSTFYNNGSEFVSTSSSFVNVDGTNLSVTLTTHGGLVFVAVTCMVLAAATNRRICLDVSIDGTRFANSNTLGIVNPEASVAYDRYNASFSIIVPGLAPGEHTFNLQWRSYDGGEVRMVSTSSETPASITCVEI